MEEERGGTTRKGGREEWLWFAVIGAAVSLLFSEVTWPSRRARREEAAMGEVVEEGVTCGQRALVFSKPWPLRRGG